MPEYSVLFDAGFNVAFIFIGAWGTLQCFWPAKYKSLRDRIPRGYNTASPFGRMIERFNRETGFLSRISGLSLLLIAIVAIVWWWSNYLGHRN